MTRMARMGERGSQIIWDGINRLRSFGVVWKIWGALKARQQSVKSKTSCNPWLKDRWRRSSPDVRHRPSSIGPIRPILRAESPPAQSTGLQACVATNKTPRPEGPPAVAALKQLATPCSTPQNTLRFPICRQTEIKASPASPPPPSPPCFSPNPHSAAPPTRASAESWLPRRRPT